MVTHRGGCHCGKVRFEFDAPAELRVSECNCSICAKSGHLGVTVTGERFRLLSGAGNLGEYRFNTGTARHLFCKHCGVKSFYVPRSHPDGFNVNFRCIDPGTVTGTTLRAFNGQEWEKQYPEGRATSFPN